MCSVGWLIGRLAGRLVGLLLCLFVSGLCFVIVDWGELWAVCFGLGFCFCFSIEHTCLTLKISVPDRQHHNSKPTCRGMNVPTYTGRENNESHLSSLW